MDDVAALELLLDLSFGYERTEINLFRKAADQFNTDLPAVLEALREMIAKASAENPAFRDAATRFPAHAQETINPSLTDADVREMLIQHILTKEIFSKVFGENDFHRQNNVARELYTLEGIFFTGDLKKRTLRGLDTCYAANLNIEATYAAITGEYVEFPNLCFVDTIDNVAGLRKYSGHQDDLFGSVSEENVERIKRQNRRKISVIIGNPPYNANQLNENENNKNREYPDIDKRIKETYIKGSTAQKTKLYDMYARFFRWASDRVDENGVVAFISNRSFIESRNLDGFRKVVGREFTEIHIVDLVGDVRANPKLSGTMHNVFGIQTGVAISLLLKRKTAQGCRIFNSRRPEMETAEEKLSFLGDAKLPRIEFDEIRPDSNHNWINLTQNDFESLIPIVTKETKAAKKSSQEKAIFKLFASAIKTNRDEWVYDLDRQALAARAHFLIETFNRQLLTGTKDANRLDYAIKWSSRLKTHGEAIIFSYGNFVSVLNAPSTRSSTTRRKPSVIVLQPFTPRSGGANLSQDNRVINIPGPPSRYAQALASSGPVDYHCTGDTNSLPLWTVNESGQRVDNITDWALDQFRKHFAGSVAAGVAATGPRKRLARRLWPDHQGRHLPLHLRCPPRPHLPREVRPQPQARIPPHPLLRGLPLVGRLGKELMELHIGYETVEPWKLKRTDTADDGHAPRPCSRPTRRTAASSSTPARRSPASRPKPGPTSSATAARWSGSSTSTRRRNRKTRRSAKSSTPTASETTRKRSSTSCSA